MDQQEEANTSETAGHIRTTNSGMTHQKNLVGKVSARGAGYNSVEQGVSQYSIRMTAAKRGILILPPIFLWGRYDFSPI